MVSALIQRSYPYRIIYDLFIDEKIILCVSNELMAKYYEILSREKFAKFPHFFIRAEALLVDIKSKSVKYFPTIELDLISEPDDNMVVELADECFANFVITGNTTDFTFLIYKQTKIVTPREYWENNQPD